ncbi:50S ribosomal protein L25/general stress protein Ctc [Parabacteroides sp. PF5-9]|uniref:50S ribosomal protein L25/general stress protein Ctc n=1 Tax=Parabacteroides sp. PF5-9 TaxID=1742404 RepID=UPI00247446EF|nr:50S ribosomal protein L25/general stress protein Ctc [Parabacteroides sp. PF5-9]MDH6356907.1 large subunit ribosomal protein L25 [Parabacteroides sp. PF5-9]
MKVFELKGKSRAIEARSSAQKRSLKSLRKNKELPAVLYGGNEVVHFSITSDAVRGLIYTPEVHLVDLEIDGKKRMAIVKDMQFQPVTDELLHMDFQEISADKPVVIEVPVALQGYAEGVKAGGKLTLRMRKLRVKALYNNLPEKLIINVDNLGLGKSMQVGELTFEGLELMNAKNAVVCTVQLTRAARGAAAAAAAGK